MKFCSPLLLSILLAFSSTTYADDELKLKSPHTGPYTENIASVAEWKIPDGYVALDPADTNVLMERFHNPPSDNTYLIAPKTLDPWFAVVGYEEIGHVSDDEKIDADALLKTLKEGAEEGNEERRKHGWPDLHIVGWKYAPHYEEDTKRLSWAVINEVEGRQNINYFTKVLSRTGVATVVLVSDEEHLDASVADLKRQLAGFNFTTGHQYSEFTKGDKVAEVGLGALIAGGAAAVAVKTGAWKWLVTMLAAGWKLVVAAFVALVGGIKSLFRRKQD